MNTTLDFFQAQRHHKRLSLMFYGLFVVAVLFHALVLLVLCLLLTWVWTGSVSFSAWFVSLFALGLYVVFGMMVGQYRVRLGGQGLAKQINAVRLFVDKSGNHTGVDYYPTFIRAGNINDFPSGYARLYEFVTQMSIASGLPMPMVYVLPNQPAVNAFVAGFEAHDTVMVFTQGAVDTLDNEALYGLIGHEFGHILHGDSRLNLRIYVLMTGLSWFYECAEWLDDVFLGKFSSDYHQNLYSQQSALVTQDEWVRLWQGRQDDSDVLAEAKAMAFVLSLPLFIFLSLIRLLGVFGMLTHEWIIHHFNRHREFLADATSIQLTRSFGVLQLLKHLEKGTSTRLTGNYSTHLGYFFFANPNLGKHDTFFDTHPRIDERIWAIDGRIYADFGVQMTAHLDAYVLEQAYDCAYQHQKITPLMSMPTESYPHVAFEMVADQVIDGRLVVDKAWYDWRADNKANTPSWAFDTNQSGDVDDEAMIAYQDIKAINLPWQIVRHQRQAIGTLAVIEVLMLCRYQTIDDKQPFDFFDIFIKTSDDDWCFPSVAPHTLNDELVRAVVSLNRKADGMMIVRALQIFTYHLRHRHMLNERQETMLVRYYQGMTQAMEHGLVLCDTQSPKPVVDFHRLMRKMDRLWQACVMATLIQKLHAYVKPKEQQTWDNHLHKILDKVYQDSPDFLSKQKYQRLVFVLLAFLVGVQDNSLLLGRVDTLQLSLVRWCRLLDIEMVLNGQALISIIYHTHRLNVCQWALCLLVLADEVQTAKERFSDTLHTALLYDGKLTQKESDILQILQILTNKGK